MAVSLLLALLVVWQVQAPQQNPPPATGAISGVVVDGTSGEPIENASVSISGTGSGAAASERRELTDPKGRFAFAELPAGVSYTIRANAPSYFPGAFSRAGGPSRDTTPIPLQAREWRRDVQVRLWKPSAISGRVVDEAGEPIVGIFVRAVAKIWVGGHEQLAASPVVSTDDHGMYRLADLQPGRYLVEAPSVRLPQPVQVPSVPGPRSGSDAHYVGSASPGPDGRPRAYPITFFPSAQSVADAGIVDVTAGQERTGVDIAVLPVPVVKLSGTVQGPTTSLTLRLVPRGLEQLGGVVVTMTNRFASIHATVKEKDAAVIVFPADQDEWVDFGLNPPAIRAAITDVNGDVRVERLPAGQYLVVAVEPSEVAAWLEAGFFARMAPMASRISVDWSGSADVLLSRRVVSR